ncbi:hypothetical protein CF133_21925, partial [Aeromonas salmonicida]
FELCQGTLQRWLLLRHAELMLWPRDDQALAIGAIWQYRPWETLGRELGMVGKGALIKRLRTLVAARIAADPTRG